jgi:ParB family chromosome partitioning protein
MAWCRPSCRAAYGHDLPLGVRLTVQDRLEGMAPDWPESPAAVALRELQQVAGEALPEDSAELFAALLAKSQDELVRLLAVCVASTVDVVTPRATPHQPGAELAQAVGLDMAAWWKPTAEGYFKHVPKAVILEAVGEFAPESVTRLAKLKKADIASEAERLADGTGWMPAIFKAEGPQEPRRRKARSRTPRRMPRQWRMNPPRRWPLDPRRRQAPRPRPGRFAGRRSPHDPHHHQPPAHGGDLRPGTVRARRWHGDGDVRGYRPPSGWTARADLTDIHPITGRALPRAVWWIIETKE